uniref:Uncharacterized protein n=1 Tax=Setaria digitata TaxID=48799 RepID=A0A915Q7K4_9BILA
MKIPDCCAATVYRTGNAWFNLLFPTRQGVLVHDWNGSEECHWKNLHPSNRYAFTVLSDLPLMNTVENFPITFTHTSLLRNPLRNIGRNRIHAERQSGKKDWKRNQYTTMKFVELEPCEHSGCIAPSDFFRQNQNPTEIQSIERIQLKHY